MQARQVAIFGIGASGILADYTARLFNRIGLPATALKDVYKRQQLRRLLPRNDAPGETVSYQVANAQYRLTIVESTRYTTLVTIEPVSYTHLDVYKRQD